jgi:hypothetical protein
MTSQSWHIGIDREELLSIYSDTFKDAHGIRPRGILFPSDKSDAEIASMIEELEQEIREEDEYQEEKALYEEFYTPSDLEDGDGLSEYLSGE